MIDTTEKTTKKTLLTAYQKYGNSGQLGVTVYLQTEQGLFVTLYRYRTTNQNVILSI